MRYQTLILTALYCTFAAFVGPARGQEAHATVTRPGLFTYQIPPGWRVLTLPQLENPVATDPEQRDTSPYIQVDAVASTKSLADFTEANKKQLKSMVPSTEFLQQTPFVTAAGLKGVRIVATAHPGQHDQKAVYYLFDGPKETKFIVFANVRTNGFEKNAPAFDAAIKTFTPK